MAPPPRETHSPWPLTLAAIGAGAAGLAIAIPARPAGAEAAGDEPLLPAGASGAEVYEAACAACHGPDGTGASPTEDELIFEAGVTTESPVTISSRLLYEQRIGPRSQIEAILPIGVGEPLPPEDRIEGTPDEWRVGAGDVGLALKHALLHSLRTGSILSLGGDVFFPTGDEAEGFGGETFTFEPYAAYGQIISPVGFLQLQGGAELPLDDGAATGEALGRLAYGRSFNQGRFGRTSTATSS